MILFVEYVWILTPMFFSTWMVTANQAMRARLAAQLIWSRSFGGWIPTRESLISWFWEGLLVEEFFLKHMFSW